MDAPVRCFYLSTADGGGPVSLVSLGHIDTAMLPNEQDLHQKPSERWTMF